MSDFFHSILSIEAPFNMIVFVVLIGGVAGVISTIVVQARTYASHRAELQLKRELVERGLSVEEIERVMAARSPIEKPSPE